MFKEKIKSRNSIPGLKGMLLIAFIAYLMFLLIIPPFYVIDQISGGRIHAPVGHHFFWKPPGDAEVGHRLSKLYPEEYPAGEETSDADHYTVSVNKIRLAIFSIFGTGVYLLARFLLHSKGNYGYKSRYP